MNFADQPTQTHLKRDDLDGIGASLRTIYGVAEDGRFDAMLRDLDRAAAQNPTNVSAITGQGK